MQIILDDVLSRVKTTMNGDSVYAFAKKLGISQQTADCYINGKRKPSLEFIYRICSVCGCSSDWLLGLPERGGSAAQATANGAHSIAVAGTGAKVTAGGDCSNCKLLAEHLREITGRS